MDIMKMGRNPSYLGSWDIEDLPNREVTLTISKIVDEDVVTAGQKEKNTVCYFAENGFKPMILNVTNKKTICKLYKTKDTEKLKDKAIIIGVEKVKAFGDIYDALRIRPRMPVAKSTVVPKCENCKADIIPAQGMTSEQVAKYTKEKYGKCLCGKCAAAIAKGARNDET